MVPAQRTVLTSADLASADELGQIPAFPPLQLDAQGRIVPLSPEERKARAEAAIRTLKAIERIAATDSPDIMEVVMKGIDEVRPEGQKLFEGLY